MGRPITSSLINSRLNVRVIKAYSWSKNCSQVVRELAEQNEIVSRSRVARIIKSDKKYKEGYVPRIEGYEEVCKTVDLAYKVDGDASFDDIIYAVYMENGVEISTAQVARIRRSLGIRQYQTRYGSNVREKNRELRVKWIERHLAAGSCFTRHVFTDESMIQIGKRGRVTFAKPGDAAARARPAYKHPTKIMVWGGISWYGATPLIIFPDSDTRLNAAGYQWMLHKFYVPWNREAMAGRGILCQDNAPCHKAASTMRFLQRAGIKTEDWPAESPDLNPIESLWNAMKTFIDRHRPQNAVELVRYAKKYWKEKVTVEYCRKFISHIHKQMPKVLEKKGGPVT